MSIIEIFLEADDYLAELSSSTDFQMISLKM